MLYLILMLVPPIPIYEFGGFSIYGTIKEAKKLN